MIWGLGSRKLRPAAFLSCDDVYISCESIVRCCLTELALQTLRVSRWGPQKGGYCRFRIFLSQPVTDTTRSVISSNHMNPPATDMRTTPSTPTRARDKHCFALRLDRTIAAPCHNAASPLTHRVKCILSGRHILSQTLIAALQPKPMTALNSECPGAF